MADRQEQRGGWRIAHLTTADISLALLLSTELSEARAAGHTVLGISSPGPYVPRVEAIGVEHIPIQSLTRSWSPRQDLQAFRELLRTIKALDLDVLHTHNPKTGVMGRIAGRLAGVPVVVNTCHGLWATPDDPVRKRWLVYGLEGLAIRFSDYELFQNAQDEQTLRRFLRRGRHRVVGNGIDLERFRFDPAGRSRLRAEWGVTDDEILVGTVGRRVREKGLAEYADVARALSARARFVWVGPQDATDAAATDGLDLGAVQLIDEQVDMAAVYSAFDIFVLASHREGFSRASMEAAACGRALVLSDIRGCREIGEHETQLLLAAPKDPGAFRAAVSRLIDDADLRTSLGEAARQRATTEFDQRAVAALSRETYERVIRRASKPPRIAALARPHSSSTPARDPGPAANPRLWTVVVTYRRPHTLADTLARLAGQTRPPDHLIVIDNGQQPEVAVHAEQTGVEYVASPGNIGPAGGFALAVDTVLARAHPDDWVLFVDDDDPPTEVDDLDALLRLAVRSVHGDPAVAGVGLEGSRYRRRSGTFERLPDSILRGSVEVDTLFGGSLPMYRVGALRDVGGPDPQFFWGFEEAQLGLHLRSHGYRLLADGSRWRARRAARATDQTPPAVGRTPLDKAAWRRYYSVRNSTELAKRHARWPAVPYVALGGAAKGCVALLRTRRPLQEVVLPLRGAVDGLVGRLGRRVDPGSNAKTVPADRT